MSAEASVGEIAFVEHECTQGGVLCGAWGDWFWASVEADPASEAEDRDPLPLQDFPFDIRECRQIATCALHARALRAHLNRPDAEKEMGK